MVKLTPDTSPIIKPGSEINEPTTLGLKGSMEVMVEVPEMVPSLVVYTTVPWAGIPVNRESEVLVTIWKY